MVSPKRFCGYWSILVVLGAWPLGCDVPEPKGTTGGVSLSGGPCGHGMAVVNSDYLSANIAIASFDGEILSESLISSGSATVGLSSALSGDVVLPLSTPASGLVVLIDREQSVLTFVRPESGEVLSQVLVGENPHDYLEVDSSRAYVSRYGVNKSPGASPFDTGSDIVVVDLAEGAIVKSISLSGQVASEFFPRPDRMLRIGGHVVVSLQGFSGSFKKAAEARLVGISTTTDEIEWSLAVSGLSNCGGLALSPDKKVLAVSCSGVLADGTSEVKESDLVVFDSTVRPPVEMNRFHLADALKAPLQPALAFVSNRLILGTTYGDLTLKRPDTAFVLDMVSGKGSIVLEAKEAFAFGELRCNVGCSDVCLLTDASIVGLRRFVAEGDSGVVEISSAAAGGAIGLPPRAIGGF